MRTQVFFLLMVGAEEVLALFLSAVLIVFVSQTLTLVRNFVPLGVLNAVRAQTFDPAFFLVLLGLVEPLVGDSVGLIDRVDPLRAHQLHLQILALLVPSTQVEVGAILQVAHLVLRFNAPLALETPHTFDVVV